MIRPVVLAVIGASLLFITGCGGDGPAATQAGAGTDKNAREQIPAVGQLRVEIPDSVKGRWSGVVLVVKDKVKDVSEEYTVTLGGAFKIPESDISVNVNEYIPSFVMQGSSITSTSNEPNNPAAQVVVMEGGSEIFNGWLFARYPTTHAFSHPRYTLTLKEGVNAG